MVQLNFDARQFVPLDNDVIPEGWYNFVIDETNAMPTKDGNPNHLRLVLRFSIIDGPHQGRKVFTGLNMRHTNIQTMEIANRELSAICAALNLPYVQDTQQLHNIPLNNRHHNRLLLSKHLYSSLGHLRSRLLRSRTERIRNRLRSSLSISSLRSNSRSRLLLRTVVGSSPRPNSRGDSLRNSRPRSSRSRRLSSNSRHSTPNPKSSPHNSQGLLGSLRPLRLSKLLRLSNSRRILLLLLLRLLSRRGPGRLRN
jgi:hypothetical protein